MKQLSYLNHLLLLSLLLGISTTSIMAQTIMFDDFTYSNVNDPALGTFNKWRIINGVSGPPEGALYQSNNVGFKADPNNSNNRLMTLSTTVNGSTNATTHSRIETAGFEYFEGTYAARVYFSETPYHYGDANIQTFYTIVSSGLANDGSRYSELDFEYMASDKWGISPDNQVMYLTSWNRYNASPWQAWKRYFSYQQSMEGWHTFIVSCTDGVNVKYWMDGQYMGSMATTDNDGSSVYPRSPMQVAFANWIWNNVIGGSNDNRTTTMEVDWVMFYKDQEVGPQQVDNLVSNFRSQGLQRRNLSGQTYVTNPNQAPNVSLTSPSGGANFTAPASITLSANASDNDGSVTQVQFYNGSTLLATDNTAPYTFNWTNVQPGNYTITARATDNGGASATSSPASVTVVSNSGPNRALNRPVTVSSVEVASLAGTNAVDGSGSTRWASLYSDPQWIYVDLGATYNIERVLLNWEAAYGSAYQVQVSNNASNWSTIYTTSSGNGGIDDLNGLNGTGRYVRIYGTARGTEWGYSLWELEVYGTQVTTNNPPVVSLTAPNNGAAYTAPASISISASASDNDGSVTQVQFFNGSTLLSTDNSPPYSFNWSNVAAGTYTITARATDNNGAQATSSAVTVTVNPDNPGLTDITNLPSSITAQYYDSPANEDIQKLIDNQSSTKYLTFHNSGWVQFEQAEDASVITQYSITSANDAPQRDPLTWTLQGSNDGTGWTTIDSRSGEDFPNRFQRKAYTFSNTVSYSYYRLNMTNNSSNILQIAEWELLGTVTTTPPDDGFELRIEAENYSNMLGVQLEPTQDVDGVQNVGWIDATDWMSYANVNIPTTGTYTVEFRVASLNGGGTLNFHLNEGGVVTDLGTYNVPGTGGWQTWTTISHTVTLNAGTRTFGIYAPVGGWNINWFRLSSSAGAATRQQQQTAAPKAISVEPVTTFPNPVENELQITADDVFIGGQVIITDGQGNPVYEGTYTQTIDVSGLSQGIYILRLIAKEGEISSSKFMKQ